MSYFSATAKRILSAQYKPDSNSALLRSTVAIIMLSFRFFMRYFFYAAPGFVDQQLYFATKTMSTQFRPAGSALP
jgi:hypothetical protein